jgi:hypothetical protein
MTLGFVFALLAFLAVSFVMLSAYLAVRSKWIRLSFGLSFFHAELEADKWPPSDDQAKQSKRG